MDLFVSAGEASSDIHCARLVEALRKLAGAEPVRAWGLGGDRLAEAGTELLMHNREFSVMGGLFEVLSRLPRRSKLESLVEKALFARKPVDLAILVDNGEINLRLASLLHFFDVPVVYFIPPKLWVWRHSRIEDIENHVDLVLSILPFEESIYRHWEIPFEYVGNPLVDEVDVGLSQAAAKAALGVAADRPVLTVLAGSRHNEVQRHAEFFAEGVKMFLESEAAGSAPAPVVVLPAAQAIEPAALQAAFATRLPGVEVRAVKGMSHESLRAARAALVKSGTSTLEAALLGAPMVLAYHSSPSAEWVYRHIVRYRGFVGLVNLFLAENSEDALGWGKKISPAIPELILEKYTAGNIAGELGRIWRDGPPREEMLKSLGRVKDLLHAPGGGSPLERAARATFAVHQKNKGARA